VVEVRSRRPALLEAHDADFGESVKMIICWRYFFDRDQVGYLRRNKKTHPKKSGTATVYLLPTYLPPTGVDNGLD
jgi:hypothetical protein